ncbi:MAG: hypothetical protein R3C44_04950 [Chloroflexota bacterium]
MQPIPKLKEQRSGIWDRDSGIFDNQAQRLIAPLTAYSASHYYFYTPGRGQIDAEIFPAVCPDCPGGRA